jgi:uncharacterized protein YhaN
MHEPTNRDILNAVTNAVGTIEARLAAHDRRFDELEFALGDFAAATRAGFARVEGRLDRVEGRLDRVEGRLDRVEVAVVELRTEVKGLQRRRGRRPDA